MDIPDGSIHAYEEYLIRQEEQRRHSGTCYIHPIRRYLEDTEPRGFIPEHAFAFGYPDSDSSDDMYDPTRECFNVEIEDLGTGGNGNDDGDQGRDPRPTAGATPAGAAPEDPSASRPPGQGPQAPARAGPSGTGDPPATPQRPRRPAIKRIRELGDRLERDRHLLRQEIKAYERDHRAARNPSPAARQHARDVNRRIINDEGGEHLPIFPRASHNVTATALLVRAMPEPSTLEGRRIRDDLRDYLETAAVQ